MGDAALQHRLGEATAAAGEHPQKPHACLLLQVLLESRLHEGSAHNQARSLALALAKGTHPDAWQLLEVMEEWAEACATAW